MTSTPSTDHHLLLAFPEPSRTIAGSPSSVGTYGLDVRCLNAAGRWAVRGRPQAPLLVWRPDDAEAARAAAGRASVARGHPVAVVARTDAAWVEEQDVRVFDARGETALGGCEPHSAGKARRLRVETEKLAAFSLVVRAAASATTQEAYAEVSRAASKALRVAFGGGSIASTCAWLAGRAGREALANLLCGEVEVHGQLSVHEIAEAVALARDIDGVQKTDPLH